MTLIASGAWVVDIGRGLREAFFMFWDTLWALVLGFGLSGMVQAFVSPKSMQRSMGDHRPLTVARASFYGMISSSCSYSAAAMSKSLFIKGGDFVAVNVFMFASTNLVVELGIVLIALIGWQFAVSEFFGGALMIVLFTLLGNLWFRGKALVEARERLVQAGDGHDHSHTHAHQNTVLQEQAWRTKLRSRTGWANSASYTIADLTMLRKELVIGYAVAGFLTVSVPVHAWNTLFLQGHGIWSALENAIVGPFIAMISFVCSVGNIPLAAALWKSGISFGGAIAFIFGDLIALPLLFVYRRYYGLKLTLKTVAIFWLVMSLAGLITEGLFRGVGIVPVSRRTQIVVDHFQWNYTTVLNIIFLGAFGVLYWTHRNRETFKGQTGALHPVLELAEPRVVTATEH